MIMCSFGSLSEWNPKFPKQSYWNISKENYYHTIQYSTSKKKKAQHLNSKKDPIHLLI